MSRRFQGLLKLEASEQIQVIEMLMEGMDPEDMSLFFSRNGLKNYLINALYLLHDTLQAHPDTEIEDALRTAVRVARVVIVPLPMSLTPEPKSKGAVYLLEKERANEGTVTYVLPSDRFRGPESLHSVVERIARTDLRGIRFTDITPIGYDFIADTWGGDELVLMAVAYTADKITAEGDWYSWRSLPSNIELADRHVLRNAIAWHEAHSQSA